MMITTDVKPRTGLSTTTGQRNAPRLAGGSLARPKEAVSYEVGGGTLEERVKVLQQKQQEEDRYKEITNRNLQKVSSGETPEASVGGSVGVLDAVAQRTRQNFGQMGSDANQLVGQSYQISNNAAADAKARGLGQYNRVEGTAGAYRTDSGSAFTGDFWKQAAIADQAQAASLEAQRNNNRISAKTAADAASAADNAYSQRYAAAQAADAQKFASTMQMFGGLTSPGAYKYWGG